MASDTQHPLSTEDQITETSDSTSSPRLSDHAARVENEKDNPVPDSKGRIELTESEAYEHLGFSFPSAKKWWVLSVIFIVQVSMNFNTSVYANAISGMTEEFKISAQAARVGQMIFLIAYAFGSELWAPWSEELGRKLILQLSLFLVNCWALQCALTPSFTGLVIGRFLGGISSAGGSVTLGMVGDMWEADDQQYAVAFIVFSSVGGSVVGPIVGGFLEVHAGWRWNFWTQLIFGAVVQALHLLTVPETRSTVILDRRARQLRKEGQANVYGPGEIKEKRFEMKEILTIWTRPFIMFATEPIVLFLSLLSGFSDSLIFTFLEGFTPVFKNWNFTTVQIGLAFIPLLVGYFIAYFSFLPVIRRHTRIRKSDPSKLTPESRLWWLLYIAPLEPIGLLGFAWTSSGPPIPWIAPMIFSALIAIANYAIYMATIDYMIAAYGEYAASATGGNALARDFLAGVAAMYSTPFYSEIHPDSVQWPSTILAVLGVFVIIPVYVCYWKGPVIRERSKFAQSLASERETRSEGREKRSKSEAGIPERDADQVEKASMG